MEKRIKTFRQFAEIIKKTNDIVCKKKTQSIDWVFYLVFFKINEYTIFYIIYTISNIN